MSEEAVVNIVNAALAEYEEKFGQPRHEQNLGKFEKLFGALNELRGSIKTLIFVMGIPGVIVAIAVILKMGKN